MKLPPPTIFRDHLRMPRSAQPGQPGAGDFQRLLGQADPAASGLRQQLAEVFNAYGFFPRESETVLDPRTPRVGSAQITPSPTAVEPQRLPHAADAAVTLDIPEQLSNEWAPRRGASGSTSAMMATPRLVAASSCVQAARRSSAAPLPIPVRPANEGDASPSKHPVPPISRPIPRPSTQPGDRLVFVIGAETMVLSGRLSQLGDDERQRLLDALDAVLGVHGLRFAEATINGRALPTYFSRSLR